MKKVYVLDTNVILTDPNSFEGFEDNEVVIPFIVIEELEKHKTRGDEIGRNAREFSRSISKYLEEGQNFQKGISLPNGGLIRALSTNDFQYQHKKPGEVSDTADNIILYTAKDLSANTKTPVVLVTQDLLLQIKANALGVKVQSYKKNRVEVEGSGLFAGHRTITTDITKEVIDYVHESAKNNEPIDFDIGEKIHPNEFVTLKDKDTKASALLKYDGKNKEFKMVKEHKIYKFAPRNKEQTFALDLLMDPDIKFVTLTGMAGTGKTLCAIAAGLHQVIDAKQYDKLVICRPMQSVGKEMGFLPGSVDEKVLPWMSPIIDNLHFLIGGKKKTRQTELAIDSMIDKGMIELQAISLIRGRSFHNSFLICDEAQNLSQHELKTIITRAGEGTKIILTGDIEQIDTLQLDAFNNGLTVAVEKFKEHTISGHISMTKGERSELASLAAKVL